MQAGWVTSQRNSAMCSTCMGSVDVPFAYPVCDTIFVIQEVLQMGTDGQVNDKKNAQIRLRVDDATRKWIWCMAEQDGESVSEFLRHIIRDRMLKKEA